MRRLTQSGGTSSGQSSNVGTSIGAEEHMDQTAVQRNHSEARAALAAQRAVVRNADGTVSHDVYYVLSQSQKTFKKISASLIDR